MLHERINNYADFMNHDQTRQTGALYWHEYPGIGEVPLANVPGHEKLGEDLAMLRAPLLGEHTEAILGEVGYSTAEIAALEQAGAINTKLAAKVAAQ